MRLGLQLLELLFLFLVDIPNLGEQWLELLVFGWLRFFLIFTVVYFQLLEGSLLLFHWGKDLWLHVAAALSKGLNSNLFGGLCFDLFFLFGDWFSWFFIRFFVFNRL